MQSPARLRPSLLASAALGVTLVAACGSSSSETPADAATDAPARPRVEELDPCPASVAVEIKEIAIGQGQFKFDPNPATIRAGSVVKFNLSAQHNASAPKIFTTDYGRPSCYRFNNKETITFHCQAHGFVGQLVIE